MRPSAGPISESTDSTGLLRGTAVSIVHTEDGDHIHVISMRKATKREREIYSESIAN
jgi:uncharacterized DUF497 family protein